MQGRTDDGESGDAVESLVQRIAPGSRDKDLLHGAGVAARADLELARIRQIKRDIVDRMVQFSTLDAVELFRVRAAEMRYLKSLLDNPRKLGIDSSPIPSEAECVAEVVLRLLPELRKLNRYEARAYASWDRALCEVSSRMSKCDSRSDRSVPIPPLLQNEPNIIKNTRT